MRRAALTFAFAIAGCQAFLVFDQKETDVIVVAADAQANPAEAAAADAGPVDGTAPSPEASLDAAFESGDPCAAASDTTVVYCDRFDTPDAGAYTEKQVGGRVQFEGDASAGGTGGSIHMTTTQDQQTAAIAYVFSAIKPTKLRVEFDYWLTSFAHGMAIAYVRFGTYYVRVVVTDEGFLGYDEYNENAPGSDFGQRDGVVVASAVWKHLALEIVTNSEKAESAALWVEGARVAEGALGATDPTTTGLEVAFGAVDYAQADMRFDNVRITRSP